MSRDTVDAHDRDAALRRLLVTQATRAPRAVPWPALVGSVAVVAVLAGVALGATLFRQPTVPVPGETPAAVDLPPFVSADSTIVGTPMVITTSEAVAYEAGEPPVGATGLAIWAECAEGGTFDSELDGLPQIGGGCHRLGGGYVLYAPYGPNVVRVTPNSGSTTITVAWIDRGNDTMSGAEAEAALADGVVTEDEYRAGFDRFRDCMELWGAPVGGATWVGDGYLYSTSGDHRMEGALHECYGTEFRDVDISWQVAHQQRSEAQGQALVDGVITREEYLAAFGRYEECLIRVGARLEVVDRDAEVLDTTVDRGSASSAELTTCYRFEFFDVDLAWKAAHSG